MFKKGLFVLFIYCFFGFCVNAQVTDSTSVVKNQSQELKTVNKTIEVNSKTPEIVYTTTPKTYEIAGITISGLTNPIYEDYVLVGFSGLSVGDKIEVPGREITDAVKRFWKQSLFSEVKISATKIEGSKIWLDIALKDRPRISGVSFAGVKKGEKTDLQGRIVIIKGNQITPNIIDGTKGIIKKYYDEKGFNNAKVAIIQTPDSTKENHVFVTIDVEKNNKTCVHNIEIIGNTNVDENVLKSAMQKTRDKFTFKSKIRNFLRSTKYVPEEYKTDKERLISKYNELGYRDATILSDTVSNFGDNKVDIRIHVNEGKQYFLHKIDWVGNTQYPTDELQFALRMQPGDVYNQKKLATYLTDDDQSVKNTFYYNNGYIFADLVPVETNVENDSIDLEIRVTEGTQATIRRVGISGNDRLYEDVVRRELRTKPGALFSRETLMRSLREIAQTGYFDPENLQPDVVPDMETGTVDISYPLTSKASDQVEASAGWGSTGLIGKLSLKFTNFSFKNLFSPGASKGIIPQGEGQTLTLSGQTSGKMYQSFSVSFVDPWFGGKRPNTLSVGTYYSRQTGVNSSYANSTAMNNYYNGYNYGNSSSYNDALDPGKSMQIIGASVGYGKRLNWPDDYFYAQAELSYQRYNMSNWDYFVVRNGTCNNISLNLTLSRNSTDNPVYTRQGTNMTVGLEITPPFSLWDGKDYASMSRNPDGSEPASKYTWVEYNKWKFKSKTFISLLPSIKKTPVLMTRAECGIVGYYNKDKKSPFGTYYMGGDGMSGYSMAAATETIGLRGYANGSLGTQASAYTRIALELRYPVMLEPSSTIYLLSFVEAGNAWNEIKNFNPFELKRSAGVGVRIMLPMIGLMGVDWGYGFDAIGGTRQYSGSQFHFILGQEF